MLKLKNARAMDEMSHTKIKSGVEESFDAELLFDKLVEKVVFDEFSDDKLNSVRWTIRENGKYRHTLMRKIENTNARLKSVVSTNLNRFE